MSNSCFENIDADGFIILARFGNWTVWRGNENVGLEYDGYYPIQKHQFVEGVGGKKGIEGWLDHLRGKVWFTPKVEFDFLKAFEKLENIT
jgi:hypothetical protein